MRYNYYKPKTDRFTVSSQPQCRNREVEDNRIDGLRSLIGRKVKTKIFGDDSRSYERNVEIKELYPHMAYCEYQKGPENGQKRTFKICLSTADLVQLGLISFDSGYAEVLA